MSMHNKLILPLINEKLDINDILPETGFAGIYTMDINRPSLTSHVFLLYKGNATKKSKDVKNKLESFDNLYSKKTIFLEGILYVVFCFTITLAIKRIKQNAHLLLTKFDKIQICKFWQFMDDNINDYFFDKSIIGTNFEDTFVPEEDYSPKDYILTKKGEGS